MRTPPESRVDCRKLEFGLCGIIFLGLLLYAWAGIRSRLLYYGFGIFTAYPLFSWERSFLQTTFGTPGGAIGALAALLAQAYRNSALGAAVIVAALGVLFVGLRRLFRSMGAGTLRDLAWAPVVFALMIYNRYDDPLSTLLAVSLSVWMAILYISIPTRTSAARVGVFLTLFAGTYYLAGASALVFACTVCIIELLLHRRALLGAIEAVLACGGAFVLGHLIFGLEPRAVYTVGTFWDSADSHELSSLSRLLTAALYAFVPVLTTVSLLGAILLSFGKKAGAGRRGRGLKAAKNDKRAGRWKLDDPRLAIGVRVLVVAGMTVSCLALSRNHIRDERLLNYYSRQRDWDQAIALAHRMRSGRVFTRSGVFDVNRALAHGGRLGEELCAYPQDETRALFLSFDDMTGRLQHTKLLELYLDLGCPNAAEKNAYELLDNEGPSPYVLEALVRVHLAKGECESARIAFGAMRKHAGSGEYVHRWQAVMADPARAESDPLIRTWRHVQGTVDYAVGGISFESMLKRLPQETPDHRLAFEYLMAYYLLKHERAELVSRLPLLRPLGYDHLPRHYAEAVLVHSLETRTPVNAQGWTIPPDVQSQFREIESVVKNARGNSQAVFDVLAPKYGDAYTFYSMFNVCGAK